MGSSRRFAGWTDDWQLVCGPDPMMEAVETTLVDHHGMPRDRIVMERFTFVD